MALRVFDFRARLGYTVGEDWGDNQGERDTRSAGQDEQNTREKSKLEHGQ